MSDEKCISSAEAREMISRARDRQLRRYKDEDFDFNSQLPQNKIDKYISLSESQQKYLRDYYESNDISARGYFRILRLIRTIADIEDREEILDTDIVEATFYRNESEAGRNMV
jgi:magnesium chelatase family protein